MSACTLLLLTLCALPVVCGIVGLFAFLQLDGFARSHASIDDVHGLDEFKRLVKMDMYFALLLMAVGLTLGVLWGLGFWLGCTGMPVFTCAMGLFGPLGIVMGIVLNRVERRLRELPVTNPDLQAEHERVIRRWKRSPLPDW